MGRGRGRGTIGRSRKGAPHASPSGTLGRGCDGRRPHVTMRGPVAFEQTSGGTCQDGGVGGAGGGDDTGAQPGSKSRCSLKSGL